MIPLIRILAKYDLKKTDASIMGDDSWSLYPPKHQRWSIAPPQMPLLTWKSIDVSLMAWSQITKSPFWGDSIATDTCKIMVMIWRRLILDSCKMKDDSWSLLSTLNMVDISNANASDNLEIDGPFLLIMTTKSPNFGWLDKPDTCEVMAICTCWDA